MRYCSLFLVALLPLVLTGCFGLVLAGATKAGITVAQERSVGSVVDDNTIWAEIKGLYLQKDTNNLFAKINVESHEGRVLLTGSVPTPETRIEAVRLAWQPDGVKEVINEIEISDKSGFSDYTRDLWINTQVKTSFLFRKNIRSINYSVDTINSTVYLIGIARSKAELDEAIEVAGSIMGVKKVVSHVRIREEREKIEITHTPVKEEKPYPNSFK